MNKVVTINLGGNAYQLEEAGYDALRAYLDHAARQLEGNPDQDEIVADIEQAIGEKCRALLSPHRTVVTTSDIERIIAEMGPVDNGSGADADKNVPPAGTRSSTSAPPPPAGAADPTKRVYRIYEGAIISGVCNGLGAYFGVDPNIIRVIFGLLALLAAFVSFFAFTLVILAYLALVILLPSAKTDAEKAAAQGLPATAQEFIRRAREGYYDATRTFKDKDAHRAWKRKFRREMRGWRRGFQHEMHAQAEPWQAQGTSHWQQHPGAYRGLWFTAAFLSLLGGIITLFWLFALVSLATRHSAFGVALPDTMPLWVGLVIASLIYAVMISPVKGVRYALRHHGWSGGPCGAGIFGIFDTLFGFAFLALAIWLADRYVPHAHEVLVKIPPALHSAFDSFKVWWNSL